MAVSRTQDSGRWSVVEAKARLEDVIAAAEEHGPQPVARNADDRALVVPAERWEPARRRKGTLAEFLHNSPLRGSGIVIERHPGTTDELEDIDW